jgi:serpin B
MRVRLFLVCAVLLGLGACQSADTATSTTPPSLITVLPRSLSAPEQMLIGADNQLGFDLLRRAMAAAPDSNVLLSPLSAGMALGMTLNGAAGSTLDSMRLALQLGSASVADIDAGYRSLLGLLAGLDATTTFTIANSIWADSSLSVRASFLSAGQTDFDAEVQALNLRAPSTVGTINSWVKQKTNGKIPTIVNQIDPSEVMLLINAIYFKGAWRKAFDPKQTQPAPFTASDGSIQNVPTMGLNGTIGLAAITNAEVIELPYGNGAFAMTIVLPAAGHTVADLVSGLDTATFAGWVAQIHDEADIDLTLPKFTFDYTRVLNDDLSALGMRRAFDSMTADFSQLAVLTPPTRLYLTNVTQRTFVDVNEDGTEAAAVTSVGVATASSKPAVIAVNRPFLFVLRERLSGTIFFVGQVNRIP